MKTAFYDIYLKLLPVKNDIYLKLLQVKHEIIQPPLQGMNYYFTISTVLGAPSSKIQPPPNFADKPPLPHKNSLTVHFVVE